MEYTLLVYTLIGMSAKIITLGLDQISRQPGAAVTIEISQGGHQAWSWEAKFYSKTNNRPQIILLFRNFLTQMAIG
jgi:hypothetical protein